MIKPPHPDQKYIEALRNNDHILIQKIYDDWYPEVEKFALRNSGTKDRAKNLFQESIITLWQKDKTNPIELTVPFGAFFYPIYRFKWLNYLNRDKERKNIDSAIEINDLDKYVDAVIEYFNEDKESIKERRLNVFSTCFKKLSEECQKLYNLKFEGKKAKEIAELTGRAGDNAVNVAMSACRKKLKAYIEAHPDFKTLGFGNKKPASTKVSN